MSPTSAADSALWHPFADMATVREQELVIVSGDDVWVWDDSGRRLLDGTASLWHANVGHGRREIADAVADQLRRIETYQAFGDLVTEPARALAARLAALAPMPEAKVFFGSGGSDAIDTAAKLARAYWIERGRPERTQLIARTASFHGVHGYGTSIGGTGIGAGVGGLVPGASLVPHDSVGALRAELERIGADHVAAVFVEPVMAPGGVYLPPEGYLEAVQALCDDTGVLLVVDSVVCAFGRLGTWFGTERWNLRPDMVCFAKGVTSGYLPLGGVVVSGRVAEPFWSRPGGPIFAHGVTYAGHATCCAAAMANLDLLERDGLLARGRDLERPLLEALTGLADHPLVARIRAGVGLLGAVALAPDLLQREPSAPARLYELVRDAGVLVRPVGDGVAVAPPLTVQVEHLEQIGTAVRAGLDGL
ncbi:aminotransferase family protein [Pseudonocardia nigra]|uniref:aminotransferase family protein n=1 Tax=Pseudonocardia nigra TaxID=1921578 RepID=UPI001C5D5203|nr:aminotransferase class III-fold pyridoxal phosphate-dependent enzyme [Pseudonocardia nigra]